MPEPQAFKVWCTGIWCAVLRLRLVNFETDSEDSELASHGESLADTAQKVALRLLLWSIKDERPESES